MIVVVITYHLPSRITFCALGACYRC